MSAERSNQLVDINGRPMVSARSGSGFGGQTRSWNPALKSIDAEIIPNISQSQARSDDLVLNNGIAANGVQLHIDNIVGHLFRLSFKPRWRGLGITEEESRVFAREVETAWMEYAEDDVGCWIDAERKRTFTMIIREGVGTHTSLGEIMAAGVYHERSGTPFRTAIKTISPKRVCNPNGVLDTNSLRGGVQINRMGAAFAYHVRESSSLSYLGGGLGHTWKRIPRETRHGRQQFMHVFEPIEDGQTRGVNQFQSVLEQLQMLPKLQNTKMQNAIVNAMYAAVIESDLGTDAALEIIGADDGPKAIQDWLGQMLDYHEGADIRMNGVKIPHLVPGEKLNLLTSSNADNGFVELERSILRWVAAGMGVPYESLAKDYSQTTYSSARASMLEGWRYFMGRRKVIAARYASMIFSLWLEESLHRGVVKLPRSATRSFYEAKAAWCNAEWIGTGRMAIDGLKEVKEAVLRIEAGLSTYEKELAQMGEDYQEIFAQQVRETEERRRANLPPPSWTAMQDFAPDEMPGAAPPANSDN